MNLTRNNLYVYICTLIIIIISLVVVALIGLNYVDLLLKGLAILGIPMILAIILSYFNTTLLPIPARRMEDNLFKYLVKSSIILYLFSVIILIVYEDRVILYFVLLSLYVAIVFLEIFFVDRVDKTQRDIKSPIILFQLVILFLNISLGYNLIYSTTIYTTDIFIHKEIITTILDAGHLTSGMREYIYFPLFHILNSIGHQIIEIGSLDFAFTILNSIIFSTTIVSIYIISRHVIDDSQICLLSALFYVIMRPVILEGMGTITRTSAYALCLFALFILLADKQTTSSKIILVLLTLSLVLWHQTTLIYFTIILIMIYLFSKIESDGSNSISIKYILLFALSYTSYWIFKVESFDGWIRRLIAVQEPIYIDQDVVSRMQLHEYIFVNLDYILIILLSILGILVMIKMNKIRIDVTLTALILMPFYIPAVANLIGESILGYRLPILTTPFISMILAVGFLSLSKRFFDLENKGLTGISAFVFLFFLYTSILTGAKTDFILPLSVFDDENPNHLLQSELESYRFIKEHYNSGLFIITDFVSLRYLLKSSSSSKIKVSQSPVDNNEKYYIYRKNAYEEFGGLKFVERTDRGGFISSTIRKGFSDFGSSDKIYDNNYTHIYFSYS